MLSGNNNERHRAKHNTDRAGTSVLNKCLDQRSKRCRWRVRLFYSAAYVYSACGVTYLPAPAREATGINNAGDIIGAEVSGLFLYKNGILNSISSDIRPPGNYSVLTADCVACFAPYLGGLSEHDEFIATTGSGQFYLVKPSGKI